MDIAGKVFASRHIRHSGSLYECCIVLAITCNRDSHPYCQIDTYKVVKARHVHKQNVLYKSS